MKRIQCLLLTVVNLLAVSAFGQVGGGVFSGPGGGGGAVPSSTGLMQGNGSGALADSGISPSSVVTNAYLTNYVNNALASQPTINATDYTIYTQLGLTNDLAITTKLRAGNVQLPTISELSAVVNIDTNKAVVIAGDKLIYNTGLPLHIYTSSDFGGAVATHSVTLTNYNGLGFGVGTVWHGINAGSFDCWMTNFSYGWKGLFGATAITNTTVNQLFGVSNWVNSANGSIFNGHMFTDTNWFYQTVTNGTIRTFAFDGFTSTETNAP